MLETTYENPLGVDECGNSTLLLFSTTLLPKRQPDEPGLPPIEDRRLQLLRSPEAARRYTRSEFLVSTMKPTVYVETSVVSYLTSDPSRDVVSLARQQITREWWARRASFNLVISEAVLQEAQAGNEALAARRLDALQGIPEIQLSPEIYQLARLLVDNGPLPEQAVLDAVHIAAAVSGPVDYLLTWNFKHMANAVIRRKIEKTLRKNGFAPCVICTPEELMEE